MGVFMYDSKPVKYWKSEDDVYIYEDPVLRSEEEKDYLIRIEENKRSRKQFDENNIMTLICGRCTSFELCPSNLQVLTYLLL